MKKKAFKIKDAIIIIVGIILIISLSLNILRLLKLGKPVEELKNKLLKLEKEHQELLEKKKYYSSDEFIEEQARDVLNMTKSGETIVVLPENQNSQNNQSQQNTIPNPKKWLKVFF
jgi:cell division protein FtsB